MGYNPGLGRVFSDDVTRFIMPENAEVAAAKGKAAAAQSRFDALHGTVVDGVIPYLERSVKNGDRSDRIESIQLLVQLAPHVATAISVLAESLSGDDLFVVAAAIEAIGESPKLVKETREALISFLESTDPGLAWAAALALSRLDKDDLIEAAPNLLVGLTHPSASCRSELAKVFVSIACELSSDIASELAARMSCEKEQSIRSMFCEALAESPFVPASAIEGVKLVVLDDDPETRLLGVRLLKRLISNCPEAGQLLADCCSDQSAAVRSSAIEGLYHSLHEESAFNAVVEAANDSEASVRQVVATTLAAPGRNIKEQVQHLCGLLKDRHHEVVVSAIESLGRIGREANSALPSLVSLLAQDSLEKDVLNALKAIATVGDSSGGEKKHPDENG